MHIEIIIAREFPVPLLGEITLEPGVLAPHRLVQFPNSAEGVARASPKQLNALESGALFRLGGLLEQGRRLHGRELPPVSEQKNVEATEGTWALVRPEFISTDGTGSFGHAPLELEEEFCGDHADLVDEDPAEALAT